MKRRPTLVRGDPRDGGGLAAAFYFSTFGVIYELDCPDQGHVHAMQNGCQPFTGDVCITWCWDDCLPVFTGCCGVQRSEITGSRALPWWWWWWWQRWSISSSEWCSNPLQLLLVTCRTRALNTGEHHRNAVCACVWLVDLYRMPLSFFSSMTLTLTSGNTAIVLYFHCTFILLKS